MTTTEIHKLAEKLREIHRQKEKSWELERATILNEIHYLSKRIVDMSTRKEATL